jgi:hypothetical protein
MAATSKRERVVHVTYSTWDSSRTLPHNIQLLGLRHRRYTAPSAWQYTEWSDAVGCSAIGSVWQRAYVDGEPVAVQWSSIPTNRCVLTRLRCVLTLLRCVLTLLRCVLTLPRWFHLHLATFTVEPLQYDLIFMGHVERNLDNRVVGPLSFSRAPVVGYDITPPLRPAVSAGHG